MTGAGVTITGERGETTALEPELFIPIEVVEPVGRASPLVLSSPHSGRIYPARFLAASRLDAASLRRSEDAFVDELFAGGTACGAPMVRALFPRAFLDVNREPFELDPRMFEGRLPPHANTRSLRVAAGLGTIARLVAESREIYARRIPVEEALHRIESSYRPYHAALRRLMQRAQRRFGVAVLLDCHSMPSHVAGAQGGEKLGADVVLGDRFGTSCDPEFTDLAETELRRRGYRVQRNKPYAGGFITEHYGRPSRGLHALQIEVNRSLYVDETTLEKRPDFDEVAAAITLFMKRMAEHVESYTGDPALAAE